MSTPPNPAMMSWCGSQQQLVFHLIRAFRNVFLEGTQRVSVLGSSPPIWAALEINSEFGTSFDKDRGVINKDFVLRRYSPSNGDR